MRIEKDGWAYYDKLPDEFHQAKIEDFVINGRRRIGMIFLIKWVSKPIYQECKVTDTLTSSFLKPFIDENRVFVNNNTLNL